MVAERKFKTITVFEQRDQPGGIWNYTGDEGTSSSPSEVVDGTFASPVYDSLETNIPNSLMQYCEAPFASGTALFPTHYVVKEYLHRYAEELRPLIRFRSQVLDISLSRSPKAEWSVTWRDIKSDTVSTDQFDGVVVANGHYNEPNIPAIPGLEEWNRQYPGSIMHSSVYRRAGPFANKVRISI
jgi:cation diffusion facilitator CzcD-associated flavoprotein CzcO